MGKDINLHAVGIRNLKYINLRMSLGKWNELKGSRYDIKADFAAKEYSVTFKKAKMHDAGTYQVFF